MTINDSGNADFEGFLLHPTSDGNRIKYSMTKRVNNEECFNKDVQNKYEDATRLKTSYLS
jgi:hypothetical protein